MYSAQKGASLVLLILLIAVLLGAWFVLKSSNQQISSPLVLPASQVYEDTNLKFQFKYDNNMEVVNETEEEYSKRTQTDYRKNFAGYVQYQPPVFIKGLIVKPKDSKLTSSQFEQIPLTIWVFENSKKLDQSGWFKDFWYYPFVWGIFAEPQKSQIAPSMDATVSGILTKSATITYSPGNPKFILVPKEDKMYLFKIMGGDKILDSFKFQ